MPCRLLLWAFTRCYPHCLEHSSTTCLVNAYFKKNRFRSYFLQKVFPNSHRRPPVRIRCLSSGLITLSQCMLQCCKFYDFISFQFYSPLYSWCQRPKLAHRCSINICGMNFEEWINRSPPPISPFLQGPSRLPLSLGSLSDLPSSCFPPVEHVVC